MENPADGEEVKVGVPKGGRVVPLLLGSVALVCLSQTAIPYVIIILFWYYYNRKLVLGSLLTVHAD